MTHVHQWRHTYWDGVCHGYQCDCGAGVLIPRGQLQPPIAQGTPTRKGRDAPKIAGRFMGGPVRKDAPNA